MQELLGRLRALDPGAVISLRVIACFDELIVGGVNSQALLSAAASLTGCVVGFSIDSPARAMRVSPQGEQLAGDALVPSDVRLKWSDGALSVWLEREGDPHANDALIIERLSLALRVRYDRSGSADPRRDLGLMVDADVDEDRRFEAAARQGLSQSTRYRFVVAPLFATWRTHPAAREDVISTSSGPLHTLIVQQTTTTVEAEPVGIGQAAFVSDFPRAFRTAVVALRLTQLPDTPVVLADDYGGLLDVLAELPAGYEPADVPAVASIAGHPWGPVTLDALVRTASVREAARVAGIHHSTMTTRVQLVTETLGFEPLDGVGRLRLGLAYLLWRLHRSSTLTLPAPVDGNARTS
ncbi:helix-turn-helix domain-containing protein [Subtercola endophyticus]|uniref:helix-turn-helix domain-containing protein n=1 Tax=Subtercola endophyticus TaxID=2895559 RepID=UPI001E3C8C4F|nr:helix-turn-helix domain-containing protein [Subtercola endophyticus]UFS60823.1 helix-turn-helix domain-containing protein [Subtercola endophyticus]